MNVYETVIEKSTKDELTELIKNMSAESEKYRTAFYAAKECIDELERVVKNHQKNLVEIRHAIERDHYSLAHLLAQKYPGRKEVIE